ncbi:auxin response factor 2 isoform X2 [Populus trichocarpa]|uniref:auxin response factor 2 isoform X2 n=2 Tax=Populus trichocarpa TaxID=3694 RepID=UPI002278868D|nr:auxin response factor 2 isoform X2 [Populus trichocarpa]
MRLEYLRPQNGSKMACLLLLTTPKVAAFLNEDSKTAMPIYDLPYKILCKVVHVQLKAEAKTDEVFAHITLLPVAEGDELSSNKDGESLLLHRKTRVLSFTKKLTPSDTSTQGGFSVPKRHAEESLPPLDKSQQPPAQELLAKDLHGSEWRFRHIYRGQPKRHLLTGGWSTFISSKRVVAGDSFIFLRGESGELRVGVRRAMKLENNLSANVVTAHSMQLGILSSASHAISTGSIFTIFFHPWTSPAEFIIPFDQYMKSAEIEYSIGTRFIMQFEGEECTEQSTFRIERCEGTVVGAEDVDHIRWPNSEWRILKVKWDAASDAFVHPERVSPWNIEPIEPIRKKHASLVHQGKKACIADKSLPRFLISVKDGLLHSSVEYANRSHLKVFQGQVDRDTGANKFGAFKQPTIAHLLSPPNPEWNFSPIGKDNQEQFWMHGPVYPCPSSTVSFPGGNIARLGNPNSWCSTPSSYGVHDNAVGSRSLSVPFVSHNSGSQKWRGFELKHANEVPLAAPHSGGSSYMLFGVNLENNPPELPSPQVATSVVLENHNYVPLTSQSSVSEPSKSTSGVNSDKQCRNCSSAAIPSCTKVLKYGTVLGRSVDLTQFDGYSELICELDLMFDFQESLIDGTSGWCVAYSDNEGDMIQIADCPWQEFLSAVHRIFICPKEETGKLNPVSPNPSPSE